MVKSSNVDLALDDIISKTRKNKNSIGKRPIGGRRSVGGQRRGNTGGGGSRPFRNPARSSGGWRDFDSPSNQGGFSSNGGNKSIRVNVSNLAPSVIASDLDELFGNFNIDTAVVNYNEHGESLGTGDITLKKRDAERLIKQFAGVALDGKVMKFAIVDSSNISARVDFGSRRPVGRSAGGRGRNDGGRGKFTKTNHEDFLRDGVHEGDTKRGGRGGQRGGRPTKRGGRDEKPKKTEAELDAELEAYMSKRNA